MSNQVFESRAGARSPIEAYEDWLFEISGGHVVLEIGSGRFPFLIKLRDRAVETSYHGLDIDESEIARSPIPYTHFVDDLSKEDADLGMKFDAIFSRFVCEHIEDAEIFYRNIHSHLADDGVSVHLFPNLFSAPFLLNYILPDRMSASLLGRLFPKRISDDNKFPAYYRMCHLWGTRRKLRAMGYSVVKFHPYYGHHYFSPIAALNRIAGFYFDLKRKLGMAFFAEYFILELRK